jgi:hypothetical protein
MSSEVSVEDLEDALISADDLKVFLSRGLPLDEHYISQLYLDLVKLGDWLESELKQAETVR